MEKAKIIIQVPPGCRKTELSVDALDKNTRDLAWQTFMYVDGKQLLCRSLKIRDKGERKTVLLEVMEECFEIVEKPG